MLKLQRGAARAHTSYLEATKRAIFSLALCEPAELSHELWQPRTLVLVPDTDNCMVNTY